MSKAGKIFLYIFSCLPFIYLIALLVVYNLMIQDIGGYFLVDLKDFLAYKPQLFYFIFITPLYSSFLTYLAVKKMVSLKVIILNISLMLSGIFTVYLTLHFFYNLWHCYYY